MRGRYCPGAPDGDRNTKWKSRRTFHRKRRGEHFFTPQSKRPRARRPETRLRLARLCLCDTHQHKHCAACAAVGKGVRQCCTRRHLGHPHHPAASPEPRRRARVAGARTLWRGGGGDRPNGAGRSGQSRLRPLGSGPSRGGGRGTPPPKTSRAVFGQTAPVGFRRPSPTDAPLGPTRCFLAPPEDWAPSVGALC